MQCQRGVCGHAWAAHGGSDRDVYTFTFWQQVALMKQQKSCSI